MNRKLGLLLLSVCLLAACGSNGSSKAASPTSTTISAEAQTYVDAALAGLIASTPKAERASLHADLACVASSIVTGIGVARFKAANVTVAKLRDPDFEPPVRIAHAMPAAARLELASRLQTCGIGRMVGSQAAVEFAKDRNPGSPINRAAVRCFGNGFEGAAARPMIAAMMLNDLDAATAESLSKVFVNCFDMAPILADAAGVTLSAAEDRCIETASRHDPAFVKLLADEFRGVDPKAQPATLRFGISMIECLEPANRAKVLASDG